MRQVAGFFESLSAEIDSATAKLPDADAVFDAVTHLFDGKVGEQPERAELEARHKEADRRKQAKAPPGYMDKKPGDYLIWAEMKEKAKASRLPILFITSDVKEDWWLRHNGKTIGPRPELRDEFLAETGQMFYAYQADRFISLVAERNANLISDETVREMQRLQNRRLVSASSLRLRSKIRDLSEEILRNPGVYEETVITYAMNIATTMNLIGPTIAAQADGKITGDDPVELQKLVDEYKSEAMQTVIYSEDDELGANNILLFDKLVELLRDGEYWNEAPNVMDRLASTRERRERMEEIRQLRDMQARDAQGRGAS
ncbi:MAG: hypothetical protein EOQ47_09520 [Mesorhizobium sp.]|nr:MAG: hypothetical protein EOQ47_09520 [Mesorhizobium sp.]TKB07355.1 MAG: hypothetical protein E5V75_33940 [Mesorhizobium sp.]